MKRLVYGSLAALCRCERRGGCAAGNGGHSIGQSHGGGCWAAGGGGGMDCRVGPCSMTGRSSWCKGQNRRRKGRNGRSKGQNSGGQYSQGEFLLPVHCLVWKRGRGVHSSRSLGSEEAGGLMGSWSTPPPGPHLDVPVGDSVHGDGVQQGGVQLLDVGRAVHFIHKIPDGSLGL